MAAFENARQGHWLKVVARTIGAIDPPSPRRLDMQSVISCRCATIPVCQHAVNSDADRSPRLLQSMTNARALLLACALNNSGRAALFGSLDARLPLS